MNDGLNRLYEYAEQEKILVCLEKVGFSPAVTVHDTNDNFYVVMDTNTPAAGENEEKTILMHELAHIATGAFYKNEHDKSFRQRMENRATRWLIEFLLPEDEIKAAISYGYTASWELAEHFDVSESLMRQALFYYQNRYIAGYDV